MGNKSALTYSDIKANDAAASAGSPFWASKNSNRKTLAKTILKQVWRWTKIAIFLFMMLMGLWGCFQSMGDSTILQNSALGNGLEFGFPFGTTGDYRFDLQMAADATQYNTLTDWGISAFGCHSPFYALFVWPAAWIVNQFMWITKDWWGGMNALLAIFLLLLFIRILTMAISLKSSFQNEKMTEVQGQIAEINAKYKDLNDNQSKQMKQQEIMALYKKNNVKPFAAFEQMFLTLPIFLIIYRVVTIVRPIKVTVLFGIWNFAASPLTQIFSSFTVNFGWTYIFFLLLVAGSQIFSMKMPQLFAKKRNRAAGMTSDAGKQQYKKTQRTQNIFMIVMVVIVAFSAVGVGVYWFLNSLFSVAQSWIMHVLIQRKKSKDKQSGARLVNFEI